MPSLRLTRSSLDDFIADSGMEMHSSLENGEIIMRSLEKHATDRNCIIGLIIIINYKFIVSIYGTSFNISFFFFR